jgi:Rps23 Pro-64 3,4-dihydroxylase Tpa1-like proline 4-hydroxylase
VDPNKNIVEQYADFLPIDIHQHIQELAFKILTENNIYDQRKDQETSFYIDPDNSSIQLLYNKILNLFDSGVSIKSLNFLLVYNQNYYKDLHADNIDDFTIKMGVVYVINDNYTGGELHYPSLNLKIKPKANTLVIHSAGLPHEVLPVQSKGPRLVLTCFVHSDIEDRAIIKPEVPIND